MSKIKVSTLTDERLDYWVAKANGEAPYIKQYFDGSKQCWIESSDSPYSPSTDWSQGGPIIERERIMVEPFETWFAHIYTGDPAGNYAISQEGTTPLIAAMRCFAASKLGEEVDANA